MIIISRGIIEGINKIRASQSVMASNMNDFDPDPSTEEVEDVSDFEEAVPEFEMEPKPITVIPRKVRPIKKAIKEQSIKSSSETPRDLETTAPETPNKKREILEPLKQGKAVDSVKAPSLPTALRPKGKKEAVRFTTHVDSEILENIQYLKAKGKIKSISSLVSIALLEFMEKYKLME